MEKPASEIIIDVDESATNGTDAAPARALPGPRASERDPRPAAVPGHMTLEKVMEPHDVETVLAYVRNSPTFFDTQKSQKVVPKFDGSTGRVDIALHHLLYARKDANGRYTIPPLAESDEVSDDDRHFLYKLSERRWQAGDRSMHPRGYEGRSESDLSRLSRIMRQHPESKLYSVAHRVGREDKRGGIVRPNQAQ